MSNLFGKQVAIVSYRLGTADGVSVTAAQWVCALRQLGMRVRTVAGDGRPDVLIRGLAVESRRPPSHRELAAALDDVDLVVADNICSLPMNRAVGEALAAYLRGRPAVLRHHDLPWERERYAHLTGWPPQDPAWWHVTINEMAREALAVRRGIRATTIYHGFDERPCPEQRAAVRRLIRVGEGPLVLQPTRAIARKGIDVGLALTAAIGGTYWITGPAEDGYQADLDALLSGAGVEHRRRLPFGVQMAGAYAASDVVAMPSSWEGFGLPLIEAALHRRPVAVGTFPVARELAKFGFEWFDAADPGPLRAFLADPDPALLDRNEAVARAHFGIDALARRLSLMLSGAPMCAHSGGPATEAEVCDCLSA
ncbi:MAG TPA: glycosyltransferase family 4 protein [Pseudonocardia sp.]